MLEKGIEHLQNRILGCRECTKWHLLAAQGYIYSTNHLTSAGNEVFVYISSTACFQRDACYWISSVNRFPNLISSLRHVHSAQKRRNESPQCSEGNTQTTRWSDPKLRKIRRQVTQLIKTQDIYTSISEPSIVWYHCAPWIQVLNQRKIESRHTDPLLLHNFPRCMARMLWRLPVQ